MVKKGKERKRTKGRRTGLDIKTCRSTNRAQDDIEDFDDYSTSSEDSIVGSVPSPLCSSPSNLNKDSNKNTASISIFSSSKDDSDKKDSEPLSDGEKLIQPQSLVKSNVQAQPLTPRAIRYLSRNKCSGTPSHDRDDGVPSLMEHHPMDNIPQCKDSPCTALHPSLRRTGKRLGNFGRRTGLDMRVGKRIRVDQNGMECFDDYWTSSDESCAEKQDDRPSPKCSNPSNLSAAPMSSFDVSQTPRKELPEKISYAESPTLRSHVQEKQLCESVGIKPKIEIKKLFVKVRKIGQNVFAGKEIKVIDGVENFEGYWTDNSGMTCIQGDKISTNSRKYASFDKISNFNLESQMQECDSKSIPNGEISPESQDLVKSAVVTQSLAPGHRDTLEDSMIVEPSLSDQELEDDCDAPLENSINVESVSSDNQSCGDDPNALENSMIVESYVSLKKSPRTHRYSPKEVEAVNSPGEDAEQSRKMRAVEQGMTPVGDVSTQTHYDSLLGQKMTGDATVLDTQKGDATEVRLEGTGIGMAVQTSIDSLTRLETSDVSATIGHLLQKVVGMGRVNDQDDLVLVEGAPKPHNKRGRKKKPPAVASTAAQENGENVIEPESGEGQLRRSTRTRFPPLETWRGEHLLIKYENGQIAKVELVEGREPDNSSYDRIRRDIEMRERRKKEKEKVPKRVKLQENSMNLKKIKKDINKVEVLDPKTGDEELVYLRRPHDTLLWTVPPQQDKDDASYTTTKCFSAEKGLILKKVRKNLRKTKKCVTKTAVINDQTGGRERVYLHKPHDSLLWTVPVLQGENDVSHTTAKTFHGRLISFGYVKIRRKREMERRISLKHNIAFNVVKGNRIKICVNKTTFTLNRLDSVVVPDGNAYSIVNKGKTDALLHFSSFEAPIFDYQYRNMNTNLVNL